MDSSTADSTTAALEERQMTLKCQSVPERPAIMHSSGRAELLGLTLNIQLPQFLFPVSKFHLSDAADARNACRGDLNCSA
jgi:hypothetical protein